jgi:hypothetical protein
MVIFRVQDDEGHILEDFDVLLTAGARNSVNELPRGFLIDRQRNGQHSGTLTLFFNHAVMSGCGAVEDGGKTIREALQGVSRLGLRIAPFETSGYAHYVPGRLGVDEHELMQFLAPNATTLVDITLRRIVHKGVFRLTQNTRPESFKGQPAGEPIASA